jgi:hypothetical protein
MKMAYLFGLVPVFLIPALPASAYMLRHVGGGDCVRDGSACDVLCDETHELAGTMYWNDGVWTDGVKRDADRDAEAKSICAANGTACK